MHVRLEVHRPHEAQRVDVRLSERAVFRGRCWRVAPLVALELPHVHCRVLKANRNGRHVAARWKDKARHVAEARVRNVVDETSIYSLHVAVLFGWHFFPVPSRLGEHLETFQGDGHVISVHDSGIGACDVDEYTVLDARFEHVAVATQVALPFGEQVPQVAALHGELAVLLRENEHRLGAYGRRERCSPQEAELVVALHCSHLDVLLHYLEDRRRVVAAVQHDIAPLAPLFRVLQNVVEVRVGEDLAVVLELLVCDTERLGKRIEARVVVRRRIAQYERAELDLLPVLQRAGNVHVH